MQQLAEVFSTCPTRLNDVSLHIHIHASTCQLCYHVGVTSVKVFKVFKQSATRWLEVAALRSREKLLCLQATEVCSSRKSGNSSDVFRFID